MQLVVGKRYSNLDGDIVQDIAGPVPKHPGWVWTNQGNWFVQATGQFVSYSENKGFVVLPQNNWRTLSKEVTDEFQSRDE